ncbi:hypothetical protein [Marinagarivorans algicola]|uniref:hypothetical protein n=1 Tax=Marinagarivorans algicola TaxID=1513270 RepID=UPI0006B8B29E|nr:hypothetical protein [Marinagarivorans algicola]
MRIKGSLKYKILRLVLLQAIFLTVVLISISLINPSWVFSSAPQHAETVTTIKKIKHEYAMLNTLSMQLASYRNKGHHQEKTAQVSVNINETPTYEDTIQALNQHIHNMKKLSQKGQSIFNTDFSVLISFLFNYQNQIKTIAPQNTNFEENLWRSQLFFSRIQSEIFYIIEGIDQALAMKNHRELKNTQMSLLIWGIASFIILIISNFTALTYANKWKKQIAYLLNLAYRASIDNPASSASHYLNETDDNIIEDELDYLVIVLQDLLHKYNHPEQPKKE